MAKISIDQFSNYNRLVKRIYDPSVKGPETTQTAAPPSVPCTRQGTSDHQCAGSPQSSRDPAPFHAQEKVLASSSWADQVPNFRQEIRQSHYRNDPVKYDLNLTMYLPSSYSPQK